MRRLLFATLLILATAFIARGQDRYLPVDTTIVTKYNAMINGEKFNYTATTGTQPVVIDDVIVASLYYTYYTRDVGGSRDTRPLLISFNGGPGAASVWMHMAYTGPKILKINDEGYPVQPYGVRDNPYSILNVADIVYVNPVNTGYSRMVRGKDGKMPDGKLFFGINADIEYLAAWISDFVSRNNRWLSPKYIIGESYGGTRVSGLAYELQNRQWMYLNGVIMVSPADYKIYESDVPISSGLNLPYFTAAAWYHGMLPDELQEKDLLDVLPESEEFTITTLIPALTKGGFITDQEKLAVARKMSYYSGVSEKVILQHNLDMPTRFFWKELLRDESGHMIGRLDSRYIGIDRTEAGISPDFSIEMNTWNHAFTPAINYYTREVLGFKTDMKYNMSGDVRPWDRSENNVRENLRLAMASNPFLHVMFQGGYYDGACTYFASKYTMWQIDPSGKMKDRLSFKGYRSGHMMYLRREDLERANNDIRDFIKKSLPDEPAKYER
ncbi:MAG TPA: carboxypeptidase [Bacteroidetes bacterium]|nr:carboxypeptidase [Bacteroidota bacterium]